MTSRDPINELKKQLRELAPKVTEYRDCLTEIARVSRSLDDGATLGKVIRSAAFVACDFSKLTVALQSEAKEPPEGPLKDFNDQMTLSPRQ